MRITEDPIPKGVGIRSQNSGKNLRKGVVWHYTANPNKGADARAHRKYWETAKVGAHYVVDSQEIIHCVPDDEIVFHAGPATEYTHYIKEKYPQGANTSLIGVELCINEDGDWDKTVENAIQLGVYLCRKYNWNPDQNFERHYDCTRKACPKMWTPFVSGGNEQWQKFKNEVKSLLGLKDISDSPFKEDIEILTAKGILHGYSDGTFRPNQSITRGELAAVIRRTLDYLERRKQ